MAAKTYEELLRVAGRECVEVDRDSDRPEEVTQSGVVREERVCFGSIDGAKLGRRSASASARARVIRDPKQIGEVVPGEMLVTEITDPDWEHRPFIECR